MIDRAAVFAAERWLRQFYLDEKTGRLAICKHGHYACSTSAGGPCVDEVLRIVEDAEREEDHK